MMKKLAAASEDVLLMITDGLADGICSLSKWTICYMETQSFVLE